MKRILLALLIAFAFSPAVETSRSQSTGQGQNSRINLSGIWEDAGEQVTITDSGGTVTARYSNQKQCRHEETVTPYTSGFVVSGTSSTLRGTGTICYYGPKKEPVDPPATPDPSPRGVKQDSQVTLTVSADGKTLTGTQIGYHGPVSFTLTRKCDPSLYEDYLRKQQASRELFQHGQDLRRQADQELVDHLRDEARRLGIEVAADIAFDQAVERGTEVGKRYLNGQRSALAAKAAELAARYAPNASGAATVGMGIGGLIPLAETAYRGYDVAGRMNDYNDESKNAAAAAARLWQSALADFKADLAQAEACLEESREAAAEERRLDEAKALIEGWENNQVLYRDPITQEALVYESAIKRALQHLGYSPRQSRLAPALQRMAFVQTADSDDQVTVNAQQLGAAIREMDIAIASFSRMSALLIRAVRAQKVIDEKLAAITQSSVRQSRSRPASRSGHLVAKSRIEDIKKKIGAFEKIKGFWENIKAGSCVPPDVYQTIRQVAEDHRSKCYSENCPPLCKAAADWFGRINPGPQTVVQKKSSLISVWLIAIEGRRFT